MENSELETLKIEFDKLKKAYEALLKENEELKVFIKKMADHMTDYCDKSDEFVKTYLELCDKYEAALRENQKLREYRDVVEGLVEALSHSKAAMTYAYEDHADGYYLNTKEVIDQALEAYRAATKESE